ncbi:MAG TPA: ATPase domain-containing protein [Candidatus Bathyarchaeia archaeon]|nr:ATPase domain-containing protein [Candidatus Bathyarchaeia archaeon]
MRLRTTIPFVLVALAVAMAAVPTAVAASYVLTISPNTTVSLGTQMTMTLDISGGSKNTAYTLVFEVVKPNGTGSASTSRVLTTDNRGVASTTVPYPDPSFTATSGTVATDVGGVYNVVINQTAPTNIAPVASGQFTVSAQLTVVVSQPVGGTVVQRGGTLDISATVSSLSGADTLATVWANSPSNARIFLTQSGVGVYTSNYQVTTSDPTGSWTITVQATDTQGNAGQASPVSVSIARNDLIVDSLVTYNSKGTPATAFSPGDTVYAFFRIRYSSGSYLTTGQYPVEVKNPSGDLIANLTASYDSSRFGFYTATGYPISTFASGGTWTVLVSANSINDGYGNTGPGLDTSVPLDIAVSPLSYWPFVVAGLVAVLGGLVTMKRFDTTLEGFQHLEQLMGGPVPRGASIFLLGDAGSGKTILSYELLHEELETGKLCALLSYDAFPEDVQARMSEFGWDIVSPLRKGRLKIVDCYSGLAGQGEGAIKDPSDLTEMNIQVTAFIGKAKGGPVTVVLDSLTPIFNGVEEKQALNFIQTLGAKVKKTGGLFVLTASKGAIPDDSVAKIKTMTDGVLELSITRTHGKARRFLSVLKMERRVISSGVAAFEINRSRGLVFRVSRFGILRKQLMSFLRMHHLSWPRMSVRRPASSSNKASPTRQR